jgi:plasmid stabilization system protein ParE
MQLRWTEEAADDLEHIVDYLFEQAPDRAAELVRTVYDAPATLLIVTRILHGAQRWP